MLGLNGGGRSNPAANVGLSDADEVGALTANAERALLGEPARSMRQTRGWIELRRVASATSLFLTGEIFHCEPFRF